MQSNEQQAYDRGITIFSPDGRLYQVEYAREAVKRGDPTVGVRTGESVVFASVGRARSPLMDPGSIEKLHDVDGRIAVATAGHVADARRLVSFGRRYAQHERFRYGEAPGVEPVATALADHVQETTQTGGTRPFGAALLVGGVDPAQAAVGSGDVAAVRDDDPLPALYEIDPSGTPSAWQAAALGNGSADITSFLEAEYAAGLDTEAGVTLALQALDAGTDADLTVTETDIGVAGRDGFRRFDPDRRGDALADAGLAAS